jgi:hypothetical protein
MVKVVEVLDREVVREEWFFDFEEGLPLYECIEEWRDERGVPKGERQSPEGHRWYLVRPQMSPDPSHGSATMRLTGHANAVEAAPYNPEEWTV